MIETKCKKETWLQTTGSKTYDDEVMSKDERE